MTENNNTTKHRHRNTENNNNKRLFILRNITFKLQKTEDRKF